MALEKSPKDEDSLFNSLENATTELRIAECVLILRKHIQRLELEVIELRAKQASQTSS